MSDTKKPLSEELRVHGDSKRLCGADYTNYDELADRAAALEAELAEAIEERVKWSRDHSNVVNLLHAAEAECDKLAARLKDCCCEEHDWITSNATHVCRQCGESRTKKQRDAWATKGDDK